MTQLGLRVAPVDVTPKGVWGAAKSAFDVPTNCRGTEYVTV